MSPVVTPWLTRARRSSDQDASQAADTIRLAEASVSVAIWTAISRVTGLGRMAMVAAVLGPTYLGNTFQATNLLPNLTYELLIGSLLVGLFVPPLVQRVDCADRKAVERLAGGLLGVMILGLSIITVLAIAGGPILLRLLTFGVQDPTVASSQQRVGLTLLVLLMPQVLLYGVAGTCVAIMNAHGRFALPAAAPALENLGVVATLTVVALMYGGNLSIEQAGEQSLLVLGLGTTAAVGLHAATQWWGVRRLGLRLRPRAGWRDHELRGLIRKMLPSLGYAGLNSLRNFSALVVANRVPGGIVAFQLALNFFNLPVALGARPVAVAALPQLARLHQKAADRGFKDELIRSASLACFLTMPAALAYLALAGSLAEAVSFGQMASAAGIPLVAVSLAALAPGILGETGLVLGTNASYARGDTRTPLAATATRTVLTLVGMALTLLFAEGLSVLALLGASISAANLIGCWQLAATLHGRLPRGGARFAPAALRTLGASAVMVMPVHAIAVQITELVGGQLGAILGVATAVLAGVALYVAVQRVWRSPELRSIRAAVRVLG